MSLASPVVFVLPRKPAQRAVSIFASAGRGRVQILSFSVIRCLKVFYTFPLSLILAQSHTGHWVATSSGAPSRGKRIASHVTLVESASAVSYPASLDLPSHRPSPSFFPSLHLLHFRCAKTMSLSDVTRALASIMERTFR